jgi:alanyl-tRNA synthetase
LKVLGDFVVLDQTGFYPTSGGQLHDLGSINGKGVKDVFRQGGLVVHKMDGRHGLKGGMVVKGEIDAARRLKLSQQHTATHIVNAAARRVLGDHVNQAGAKKTEERSHLDITHYQPVSADELKEIEKTANKIVKRGVKIEKMLIPRNVAEKRFGMRIYQGGAVPGRTIRIVNIPGVDVEACGGTHLNNTREVGKIKILKTSKIQDGIIRIEFTAGEEAGKISERENEIFNHVFRSLNRILQFDGKISDISKQLRECSDFFSVPVRQVGKTVEKFVNEIMGDSEILNEKIRKESVKTLKRGCEIVFSLWKYQKKELERLMKERTGSEVDSLLRRAKGNRIVEIVEMSRKEMIRAADLLVSSRPDLTVILINKNGDVVGMGKRTDIVKELKRFCKKYGGSGGGKGFLAQGKINFSEFKRRE